MKRKKTLLVLLVILVAAVAAVLIESGVKKHIEKINTVDETIVSVDPATVNSVSWTKDGTTLSFTNTDGIWTSDDDVSFPVDGEKLEDFLETFADLHASFIIEDVEDFDQYGLKSPQCTITINAGESRDASADASGDTLSSGTIEISLGNYSTMDEKRYVTLGGSTVYLIDTDFLDDVSTDRDDFIKNDTVDNYAQVTALTVTGASSVDLAYEEPEEDEDSDSDTETTEYYYVGDGEHLPLSTDLVNTYLSALTTMTYDGYETYKASDADLSQYGLDDPALTITVTGDEYTDGESDDTDNSDRPTASATYTIYFGYLPGDEDDEDDDLAYVRFDGSEIIYDLDVTTYKTLAKASYASLRPTEVVDLDWSLPTYYTVNAEGSDYTIVIDQDAEDLAESDDETSEDTTDASADAGKTDESKYTLNGKAVSMAATIQDVNDLALSSAEVDKIDSSKKGTLEFSFTIDQGDTTYTVCLYRYDGDDCIATLNGETIGLVSRSDMVELREDMLKLVLNQ